MAASVALTPVKGRKDGGFCVLPGSHKLNFPVPDAFANGESTEFDDHIYCPDLEPGDVVLFSEATVHGALPWLNTEYRRKLALLRFAPPGVGYGRAYLGDFNEVGTPFGIPKNILDKEFTEAQLAVIEPPYNNRMERAELDVVNGEVVINRFKRSEAKKAHDRSIFGTPYF